MEQGKNILYYITNLNGNFIGYEHYENSIYLIDESDNGIIENIAVNFDTFEKAKKFINKITENLEWRDYIGSGAKIIEVETMRSFIEVEKISFQ